MSDPLPVVPLVLLAAGTTIDVAVAGVPGAGHIGTALCMCGLSLLVVRKICAAIRETGRPAADAYEDGYEAGYDKGWRDGSEDARPVLRLLPSVDRAAERVAVPAATPSRTQPVIMARVRERRAARPRGRVVGAHRGDVAVTLPGKAGDHAVD